MANLSFLPEDFIEKKSQRRSNAISLTLFVLVMTGVIGAFFVTDQQRNEVRTQLAQINSQFEAAAKRLDQLQQLQARKQEMIHKAQVTATLLERVPRSLILAQLINDMPMTLSLRELELETKVVKRKRIHTTAIGKAKQANKNANKPPQPPVQETEVSMEMEGVAPTDVEVAQFMTTLSRGTMFQDINLIVSEEVDIEGQQMRKFRIEMMLNQQINVLDMEPKMVRRPLKQNPMSNTIQIGADGNTTIPSNPELTPQVVPATDPTSRPSLQD